MAELIPPGRIAITPGVAEAFAGRTHLLAGLLSRHLTGDWGDLDADDRAANREALATGARLLSAYEPAGLPRVWIITEADRASTCILLPEEY